MIIWESSSLRYEDNPHRVDYLWGYLRGVKERGTNVLIYCIWSII